MDKVLIQTVVRGCITSTLDYADMTEEERRIFITLIKEKVLYDDRESLKVDFSSDRSELRVFDNEDAWHVDRKLLKKLYGIDSI